MSVIENRLRKRLRHLKKWAKREEVEAFRLYDRDIPEYPFIIDIYQNHILLYDRRSQEIDAKKSQNQEELILALEEIFETDRDDIIFKSREVQKGENQYEKIHNTKSSLVIQEKQANVLVNLIDYLDTGLFLDHRPLRQIIYQDCLKIVSPKVLNLFSYTCSIGLFAALGNAQTVNVDLSNTYLEWGKKNYELNNIEINQHKFVRSDVQKYLANEKNAYDIIILDPPTFSNSKSMEYTFDVQKLAKVFIDLCLNRLKPNGVLYFSNNKRDFKWDKAWENNLTVEDITIQSIPEDFQDKKIHKLYKIKKLIK